MKFRFSLIILAVLVLAFPFNGTVHAEQANPQTAEPPSVPPQSTPAAPRPGGTHTSAGTGGLTLPPLKAVIIVGPIDGDTGSWTTQEKTNADLAANELAANGVTVYKFYTPNNDWNQIIAAANGAQFLIYRGHGIYWGAMPSPPVGGFGLKDRIYSNDEIKANLKLAPNAIVMIYACFAAGTASNDTTSISTDEAQRRVSQYSYPFFANGAAGYYSDWYGNAFQEYIRSLFQGKTLGDAYKAYTTDYNPSQVFIRTHSSFPAIPEWLGYKNWTNYPTPPYQYNNAFAGQPDKTLQDLFQPTMKLSTNSVVWLAQPGDSPHQVRVDITSNSSASFSWSANPIPSNPGWLSLSSAGGQATPLLITIQPQSNLGTYETDIQITSSDKTMFQFQQTIHIKLLVLPLVNHVYLPELTH